jgi:hypothetical protein
MARDRNRADGGATGARPLHPDGLLSRLGFSRAEIRADRLQTAIHQGLPPRTEGRGEVDELSKHAAHGSLAQPRKACGRPADPI